MTPDKRVEEIVEEFRKLAYWEGRVIHAGGSRIDEIEDWLTTTLTQYHQDLMSEVVEKLEGMKPKEYIAGSPEYHKYQTLTEAQTIIKSK